MPTPRARSCLAAALLLGAGEVPAQATPDAAGAEAAVRAFVAAQRAQDWPAALRLLAPEALDALDRTAHHIVGDARIVLADSGLAAAPDEDEWPPGYDRYAVARRVLGAVREARSPRETLAALASIDASLDPQFLLGPDRMVQTVGVQLEAAGPEGTVAHVVVRSNRDDWRVWSSIDVATLRWADGSWGLLSTEEPRWFQNRPDVSGLADAMRQGVLRTRPHTRPVPDPPPPPAPPPTAPSLGDWTPATPGEAGARAAARALVDAQCREDWPEVFRLMNPDALDQAATAIRTLAGELRAVLADSSALVASEAYLQRYGGTPLVFRVARRIGAVVPPGHSLSNADVMARVAPLAAARHPDREELSVACRPLDVVGVVAEGDRLAHVIGRSGSPPLHDTGAVSMRWTGSRWVAAYRHVEGPGLDLLDRVLGSDWTEGVAYLIQDEATGDAATVE